MQRVVALAVLLLTGCYGSTPLSVRDSPRSQALLNAPYMTLARCAMREYETVVEVPDIELRTFPEDGYAEVIVGRPWVTALSGFRRVDDAQTAVTIYSDLVIGRDSLVANLATVNRECAEGLRPAPERLKRSAS